MRERECLQVGVAILTSDEINFKSGAQTRDKGIFL